MAEDQGESNDSQSQTVSLSDSPFELKNSIKDLEILLGPPLSFENIIGKMVLLRLRKSLLQDLDNRAVLRKHLDEGSFEKILEFGEAHWIILGPIRFDEMKDLLKQGHFSPKVEVFVSYQRWKAVLTVYPELKDHITSFEDSENTSTQTETETLTGTLTSNIEIEEVFSNENTKVSFTPQPTSEENPSPVSTPSSNTSQPPSTDTESSRKSIAPQITLDEIFKNVSKNTKTSPRIILSSSKKNYKAQPFVVWFSLLVFLIGGGSIFFSRHRHSMEVVALLPTSSLSNDLPRLVYPENVRSLGIKDLLSSDSPLVEKVKKISFSYQKGETTLQLEDERALRTLSDPASASWEANRLATNQLAVSWAAAGKIEDGIVILDKIYKIAPADFTTLINRGLLHMQKGGFDQAMAAATEAQNLAPLGLQWLPWALQGMVQQREDLNRESSQDFAESKLRNPQNPIIYLLELKKILDRKDRTQLREALNNLYLLDPRSIVDSPIPGPVASHIFYTEAALILDHLKSQIKDELNSEDENWMDYYASQINHLEGKDILKRFSQKKEEASQELYYRAVSEFEERNFVNCIQWFEKFRTSALGSSALREKHVGPWILAADAHYEMKSWNEASDLYQKVLNVDPKNAAALGGVALVERELGNYQKAQQKFLEAQSADPYFVPAILRVTRKAWRDIYRSANAP